MTHRRNQALAQYLCNVQMNTVSLHVVILLRYILRHYGTSVGLYSSQSAETLTRRIGQILTNITVCYGITAPRTLPVCQISEGRVRVTKRSTVSKGTKSAVGPRVVSLPSQFRIHSLFFLFTLLSVFSSGYTQRYPVILESAHFHSI